MGRLKRDNKGLLRQTFTVNGKKYSVRARSMSELAEKAEEKRRQIEKGIEDFKNPCLDAFYEEFVENRRHEVRGSTLRSQRFQYNVAANTEIVEGLRFGDMRLSDINRRTLEGLRNKLLETRSPEYINIILPHLSTVFRAAMLDGIIRENPAVGLKPLARTAKPVRETVHRALEEWEILKFFNTCEERNSVYTNFFKLMIRTGMRCGETAALYRTDIDRKAGLIKVRRTVTRDEIGQTIIGDVPKTSAGIRDLPLTAEMWEIILSQQEQNRMLFGLDYAGQLFPSPEGNLIRDYSADREIWRICKAAGLEKFSSHAFRHSFASHFLKQHPEKYAELSRLLGHASIKQTWDTYCHLLEGSTVTAMEEFRMNTG